MKFMEIKNLGLCLLTVLFFHLHLVSTASSPYPFSPPALNREQYVKDKPLMENLPSRVGKEISVSRRGGGGGHGGGRGGGRGGRGSRRGGGAAAAIIPLYAGGAAMNQHKTSHHSGSNNTGSPKAILMLLTWLWLFCLFFFLYI